MYRISWIIAVSDYFFFLHQKGVIIWGKAINSREVIISNIDWNIDYLKYFVLQSH